MDTALTNSIISASTALASRQSGDAIQIAVLKKALNSQATSATTLIDALQQSMPTPAAPPALATSGTLGTQLNTYA